MERDERQMRKDFLGVTDIFLIVKCTWWHITLELGMRKHYWVISGIYMQLALKWDQTMFG